MEQKRKEKKFARLEIQEEKLYIKKGKTREQSEFIQ